MVGALIHRSKSLILGSRHAIKDDRVSKQHFRIYSILYEANSPQFPALIYCEDLESSNGTYVNDVLVGKITQERVGYLLSDGDVVEIRPHWRFRFHQTNHNRDVRSKGLWSDVEVQYSSLTCGRQLTLLQYFRDRYEIKDRMLGKGQYGTVFLAIEAATKKQLACKVIDLDLAVKNLTSQTGAVLPPGRWEATQFIKTQKKRGMEKNHVFHCSVALSSDAPKSLKDMISILIWSSAC